MQQYISVFKILLALMLLHACEKNEISEKQSHYFIKFYGSHRSDSGSDIKPLNDGGYIIVGTSEQPQKKKEIMLMKVDKYGRQESWSPKYFGGANDDFGYSVKVLSDGYIIAGSFTDTTISGIRNRKAMLIRTDITGNLIWERKFGGTNNDEAYSVAIAETGQFVFCGYTESFGEGKKDGLIMGVSQNGDSLWSKTHGGNEDDYWSTIIPDGNGFIVLGTTGSFPEGQNNIMLSYTNQYGSVNDPEYFGGQGDVSSAGLTKNSDGKNIVIGTYNLPLSGQSQIIIKKITREQTEVTLTNDRISGNGSFIARDVLLRDDGIIVVLGELIIAEDSDIVLYFLDQNGTILDSKKYGRSGNQTASSFEITGDGGFIIVGANGYEGNIMITLIKTDRNGDIW